jgi:hypothetical protein
MIEAIPVTIYHNAGYGTSRNVLALIRNAGVEPTVIEYLKTLIAPLWWSCCGAWGCVRVRCFARRGPRDACPPNTHQPADRPDTVISQSARSLTHDRGAVVLAHTPDR